MIQERSPSFVFDVYLDNNVLLINFDNIFSDQIIIRYRELYHVSKWTQSWDNISYEMKKEMDKLVGHLQYNHNNKAVDCP